MKIDFNVVLKTVFGKPMQGEPKVDSENRIIGFEDCTLGGACLQGLFASKADEGQSGQQKMERHRIAAKVAQSLETKQPIDLKVEEVSLIKELVGKHVNSAAVGAVWDEIEAQGKAKEVAHEVEVAK